MTTITRPGNRSRHGRTLLLILLLLLALGGKTMSSSKDVAEQILNLAPDQFFRNDPDLDLELQRKLLGSDFEGLAIAAPKTISVTQAPLLPVVLGTRQSIKRGHQVMQSQNCILAGTDLMTGKVSFAQALFDPKDQIFYTPPPKTPPAPPGPDVSLEGFSSDIYRIDAAGRLNLPWEPAKLALTAISYDWVSNTIEVELTGEREPKPGAVKPVSPLPPLADEVPDGAEPLPDYERNAKTPKYPKDGCEFIIDPDPKIKAGLLVRGSFTLAAKPFMITKDPEIIENACGDKLSAAVVVPVTFAFLGLDWRTPGRADWNVPICSEIIHKPGDKVTGSFAIDALAGQPPLPPGDYVAYVFLDGKICGPVKFKR
jgi:hypothetical protein